MTEQNTNETILNHPDVQPEQQVQQPVQQQNTVPMESVPESKQQLDSKTLQIKNEDEKLIQLAEKSKIASKLGKTKVVYINKGKPTEYGLKLQYPGSTRALDILSEANEGDGFKPSVILNEAIKDVIVVPRIDSVDDFWNTHEGLGEAAGEIISFLGE